MRPKLHRTLPAGVLALVAACVAGAALAWACTPSASIGLAPPSGPSGAEVSVSGSGFVPGAPVTIRWNSPAGPVLATAQASPSGTFSAGIRIPAAAPDTHSVVATSQGFLATAAYTVVGGPSANRPDSGSVPAPATNGSNPSSGTTSGGSERARSGARAGGDSLAADGGSSATTAAGERAQRSGGAGTPAAGAEGSRAGLADRSGNAVFADSVAPASARKASGRSSAAPSPRSAASDLWAGFRPSTSGIMADDSASPTGGSMPALTATLLGLGLAAALAGLGVAGARRRARSGARS